MYDDLLPRCPDDGPDDERDDERDDRRDDERDDRRDGRDNGRGGDHDGRDEGQEVAAILAALGLAQGDVAGIVGVATALVGHVARIDLHALPSSVITGVPVQIEGHSRVVEAARARSLSALEADGTWALQAQGTTRAWYAQHAGIAPGQAGQHLKRARLLRDHLPGFQDALTEGRVPVAAIDTLGGVLADSPQRQAQLTAPNLGEDFLIHCAATLPVNEFRQVSTQWAARVDPDAEERRWRAAIDRQEITLAPTLGGWHLQGWLSHQTGLTLRAALDAVIGRPAADDKRSRGQRDAAALTHLARRLLDSGEAQPSARVRPHLTVHVPLATAQAIADAIDQHAHTGASVDPALIAYATDLHTDPDVQHAHAGAEVGAEAVIPGTLNARALSGLAPATFGDGTALAPGELAQMLCDSELTRYVFSGAGEPLNVGPARRIFSARQVKAITGRDKHCQYAGCTAPPTWCEAHHAIPWGTTKKTDVPNGILLCWTHHQQVHQHNLTITRYPDKWEYHYPDSRLHSTVPRATAHPAHQLDLWTPQ